MQKGNISKNAAKNNCVDLTKDMMRRLHLSQEVMKSIAMRNLFSSPLPGMTVRCVSREIVRDSLHNRWELKVDLLDFPDLQTTIKLTHLANTQEELQKLLDRLAQGQPRVMPTSLRAMKTSPVRLQAFVMKETEGFSLSIALQRRVEYLEKLLSRDRNRSFSGRVTGMNASFYYYKVTFGDKLEGLIPKDELEQNRNWNPGKKQIKVKVRDVNCFGSIILTV